MNASRPEADTEYSRAEGASERPRRARKGVSPATWNRRYEFHRAGVLTAGLLGALLLLVAEFTPLLHVNTAAHTHIARTVYTGSHHSYALVPIALLAVLLAYLIWTSGSRLALLATGVLGLLTLGVALLGDLPDAHASGLVGSATTGLSGASSSPGIGLYLETLGAIVLILTAGAGLLLEPIPPAPRRRRRPPSSSRTRSAS
jgi:hypothetical protein